MRCKVDVEDGEARALRWMLLLELQGSVIGWYLARSLGQEGPKSKSWWGSGVCLWMKSG